MLLSRAFPYSYSMQEYFTHADAIFKSQDTSTQVR